MFILILGLFFIILINLIITSVNTIREPFSTSSIILLGDSTLKNDSYVKHGLSVNESLSSRSTSYCYAVNDSNIADVYTQLEQIPDDRNNSSNHIFLSVGGNNIISTFYNQQINKQPLIPMFLAYTKLVKSIQTKMNKSKIYLINIYYPQSVKYLQYKPILVEWNKMIDDYANASTNNISGVVRLNETLTKETDFTYDIEPSDTGGVKIADAILNTLGNHVVN